jgi:tape measure domain-containing protein
VAQNLTFNLGVETGSAVTSINQFFAAFDQGAAKAKSTLNTAFNQKLETEVEINLKNGQLVAKEIQKASQESKRLEVAAKAINGEFGKTPASLKKQITALKQIQSNTQKFSSTTGKLSSDWKLVTQRIQEASSKLKTMTQGGPLERLKTGLTGIIGKFTLVQTLANLATSAIQGFAASGQEFLNMAGRMEVLQLQLEAFTGGSEEASAAFDEFARIAANSPFDLEQVAQAGKIMMAFGVDTETAVTSTEQLGVAAAATGGDINLLARNLGQIAAQGQAYTRDLTQFAIQGIPIWDEMSKVTGRSVTELKKMASEGKISFDIVSDALTNLTAEGTKFAQVAVRMQETFQGRMARIEASFNKLGLAAINAFNKLDRSMGGVVSGSMKAFADGIDWMAKNIDSLVIAFAGLTAGIGTFALTMTLLNLAHIGKTIGTIVKAVRSWVIVQKTLNILTAFFQGMSGNWAAIGLGIAAAAAATVAMANAMGDATEEDENLQDEIEATTVAVGDLTKKELEHMEAIKDTHKEQMAAYNEGMKARDELKAKMDLEIERLKAIRDEVKERYNDEISDIEAVISKDKERSEELKTAHSIAMDQTRERHSAALDALDAEIGLLREKTGAEEKLYNFQKKELQEKIKSGNLDKEDQLQAEARLSRMIRQEQIQALMAKKAETRITQEKEIKDLSESQKVEMTQIEEKMKTQEKQIERIKEKRDQELEKIKETVKSAEKINKANMDTNRTVDAQIGLVNSLANRYAIASSNVDNLAARLRDAAKAQRDLNTANSSYQAPAGSRSNLSGARFSGGPVSGGSSYQVNELGKEAFLSASGALSMIKAPAFGTWTAPGSGTVIPAHLTKQLNVPTGGVQVNRGAASKAAGAGGSGGIARMISALAGSMGGDTVSNNVTIQTQNPRQTASDVMVQLAKLKRLRYN